MILSEFCSFFNAISTRGNFFSNGGLTEGKQIYWNGNCIENAHIFG